MTKIMLYRLRVTAERTASRYRVELVWMRGDYRKALAKADAARRARTKAENYAVQWRIDFNNKLTENALPTEAEKKKVNAAKKRRARALHAKGMMPNEIGVTMKISTREAFRLVDRETRGR